MQDIPLRCHCLRSPPHIDYCGVPCLGGDKCQWTHFRARLVTDPMLALYHPVEAKHAKAAAEATSSAQ